MVPLDLVREHWFEDGTRARPARPLAGRPARARRRARARARPAVGGPRRLVRRRLGGAAPGLLREPVGPAELSRELAERFDSREMLHKRLKKTFKDERLRQVAAHPFVADGHDPRNVPAWAGLVAYLEQRFGAWTVKGGMAALTSALTARMATRGVTVALEVEATDIVVRDGRAVAVATTSGDGRRRRGRVRGRPADAARARAVRRAHDADDAAGGLPRRPLGAGARPAARGGRARRPDAGRPHRRPGAGRRGGVHGARPRQARRGHPQGPGPAPARPAHRPGHAGRPAARASWSSGGAPRRTACCGRAAPRCGNGSGRAPRSRACTPPARTRRPGAGCRSWDCPPRWSRRRWARRSFTGALASDQVTVRLAEICRSPGCSPTSALPSRRSRRASARSHRPRRPPRPGRASHRQARRGGPPWRARRRTPPRAPARCAAEGSRTASSTPSTTSRPLTA